MSPRARAPSVAAIAGVAGWLALGLAVLLAGGLPRLAYAADTVVYYHTDALRSVAVVTSATGQVLERTYYAPYGQVLNRPLRDGPGYTGHREDAETGLVYVQQRYYDPESGRFLSADPVDTNADIGANFNRYWYANDNPYRYTDPDGRCTGSHISNSDGTCASTGGFTTGTSGAAQGMRRMQAAAQREAAPSGQNSGSAAQQQAHAGRPLTQGESDIAHSELPDLDSGPVRVKYDQRGDAAYTPNNTMHFPKAMSYCQDFSSCDHGDQAGWFIHEVTHVWQYQQGRSPFWGHIFSTDVFSFGNYLPLSKYLKTPSPAGLSTEKQADWHMWHYVCSHDATVGC